MPICDARIFTERLLNDKTLTESDLLEMEIAARKGCPHAKEFIDSLNGFIIEKDRKQREKSDPVTQEQDQKAGRWWSQKP
jgi:hypothetical protein